MSRFLLAFVLLFWCGFACVLNEDISEPSQGTDGYQDILVDAVSDVSAQVVDTVGDSGVTSDLGQVRTDTSLFLDISGSVDGLGVSDILSPGDGLVQEPACEGTAPCLTDGPCALVIAALCVNGTWTCDYSGVPGFQPGDETTCDGIDNNCDGYIDEAFGVGVACDGPDSDLCANGFRMCATDGLGWVCGPESLTDIPEVCDEADNDCDGDVDEGFGEKNVPCDENDDGCATGTMQCADPSGGLICVGDEPCLQPNPNCLPAEKPFDVDTCGCGTGLYCDSLTASGCKQGACQCGFLGSPCADGYYCENGGCSEL